MIVLLVSQVDHILAGIKDLNLRRTEILENGYIPTPPCHDLKDSPTLNVVGDALPSEDWMSLLQHGF